MRAKIASRASGHAFEDRFTKLDIVQLSILYRQALKEEQEERKDRFEVIKTINSKWIRNFEILFENLQFFTNPKLFFKKKELEELEVHREEISPENFTQVWEELMEIIPETYVIDEEEGKEVNLPYVENKELDEELVGWVSRSKKMNS